MESVAVLSMVELVEAGEVELLSSETLTFENKKNPHLTRRRYANEILKMAVNYAETNEKIENLARDYNNLGIKPIDALHLASAVELKADYFCTCDDQFLERAKGASTLETKVVSPLELIEEVEQ